MNEIEYRVAVDNASTYASLIDYQSWNDRFLAGLYRNGLKLTDCSAHLLIHSFAVMAPRPTSLEPNLWPQDTWIVPR